MPSLELGRDAILAHRRRVQALEERLPSGADSLRLAARPGLQDSVPRAAVLALHARVAGVRPDVLDDPVLAQVWGPRFSVYVVAADDVGPFTVGRTPEGGPGRLRAEDTAERLGDLLGDRVMTYGEAGRALGRHPNSLRYGTTTGRIRIRWDGARQPTIWMVPAPDVSPREARAELARRYLHAFGPMTAASFAGWAGIRPGAARAAFDDLAGELVPARTPSGDASALAADEASLRRSPDASTAVRLLPSGDPYTLLWGADRALLVPDAGHRSQLWTSRVWPGAVLAEGEIVGTWRRAGSAVTVEAWRRLTSAQRDAVAAEAASFPLPDLDGRPTVRWGE